MVWTCFLCFRHDQVQWKPFLGSGLLWLRYASLLLPRILVSCSSCSLFTVLVSEFTHFQQVNWSSHRCVPPLTLCWAPLPYKADTLLPVSATQACPSQASCLGCLVLVSLLLCNKVNIFHISDLRDHTRPMIGEFQTAEILPKPYLLGEFPPVLCGHLRREIGDGGFMSALSLAKTECPRPVHHYCCETPLLHPFVCFC